MAGSDNISTPEVRARTQSMETVYNNIIEQVARIATKNDILMLRGFLNITGVDLTTIIDDIPVINRIIGKTLLENKMEVLEVCLEHHSVTREALQTLQDKLIYSTTYNPSSLNAALALIETRLAALVPDHIQILLGHAETSPEKFAKILDEEYSEPAEHFNMLHKVLQRAVVAANTNAVQNILAHEAANILASSSLGCILDTARSEWLASFSTEATTTLFTLLNHHSALTLCDSADTSYHDTIIMRCGLRELPAAQAKLRNFALYFKACMTIGEKHLEGKSDDEIFTDWINKSTTMQDKHTQVSYIHAEALSQEDGEMLAITNHWLAEHTTIAGALQPCADGEAAT